MALLQWSDDLSVGVVEMDRQHQRLVELVDRLHKVMAACQGDHIKKEILTEFLTCAKVHLTAEERLMRQCGYPQFADHKRLHDRLMEKAIRLNEKMLQVPMTPSAGLESILKGWLVQHIVQQDKEYGRFVCAAR
jgi:hemerythrin